MSELNSDGWNDQDADKRFWNSITRKAIPIKLLPLWDYLKMRCNANSGCKENCQECPYTRVWRVW